MDNDLSRGWQLLHQEVQDTIILMEAVGDLIQHCAIEPIQRTGFTNIVVTSSGREMVIAHSSTAPGMLLTSRPQKGTGAWTSEDSLALGNVGSTDTWAKAISGGANGETVHSLMECE
jgi:hypothetical protein